MNHKTSSISFWNQFFKDYEPVKINKEEVSVTTTLDKYLKQIGDQCENILDVGCGTGYALIGAKLLGHKMKKGLGFDASNHAIRIAKQTVELSHIDDLSFVVADESFLSTIPDQSYDGIICSNFLDVIPKEMSQLIIKEIQRILSDEGFFLLKLNFELDEALIEKIKMVEIEENTYQIDGVIRAYNLSTEKWIEQFNQFKLLTSDGFQRAPHLPEDRILWFKKAK